MDRLETEDGALFLKSLASFIRTHERALANSLQLSVSKKQAPNNASTGSLASATPSSPSISTNPTSTLAAAFSFAGLNFRSHSAKAALLTLTPHHLFYLLSRMGELDISVGPMNVRLENIHADPSPGNYVSFLQSKTPARGRSDNDSLHSVSSVRSVMSGMSSFWSSIGLGSNPSKSEKAKLEIERDITYLYSSFTKLPSIRLSPDPRSRLIRGYEEFPFDTAVPLFAFKNLQQLDIIDVDFRSFHGWDRLAEQLTLLTVKRANIDDPFDLITNIVLDDAEKRRRRSTKGGYNSSPTTSWNVPSTPRADYPNSNSDPSSPANGSPTNTDDAMPATPKDKQSIDMLDSPSPKRPSTSRPHSSYRHARSYSTKVNRSGSGSSNSSDYNVVPHRSDSSSSLLTLHVLSPAKWQRLKYLSLADNSLTSISAKSIMPLAPSLRSLNLASNLFTEIPDSLALLTRLTSLDLSNCMIESLQSLSRNPLPAILTLKLRANRLRSLAGIERLLSLENLAVQDNYLSDPMEAARLTQTPNFHRLWIKHNPLTKKHSDYRITMFNIFRKTPGYLEDIVIDDYTPGYNERKYLVERAPEIERPQAARSIQIVEPPVVNQISLEAQSDNLKPKVADDGEIQLAIASNSSRRRKPTRRRIVDLSRDESAPTGSIKEVEDNKKRSVEVTRPRQLVDLLAASTGDILNISPTPEVLGTSETLQDVLLQAGTRPDEYRQKVEALREEFGSNWISALSERGYGGDIHLATGNRTNPHHSPLQRSNTQALVSGGRTLG
jgi:Leucine-rich repeat (LRR) protein